jgi:hypothetical protein
MCPESTTRGPESTGGTYVGGGGLLLPCPHATPNTTADGTKNNAKNAARRDEVMRKPSEACSYGKNLS